MRLILILDERKKILGPGMQFKNILNGAVNALMVNCDETGRFLAWKLDETV